MASLEEFSRRIRVIGAGVEKNADQLKKKVALAVDQTVVLSTPVDEGVARSNWQVQTGYPIRTQVPAYAPGSKLGLSENANAAGALGQGRRAIVAAQPGEDIYISNNVPYIGELNNGSSSQAPANFVEKAIQVAVAAIRGARIVR